MSPHNLMIYGKMLANLALLEAMKAENAARESKGLSLAYDETHFVACSDELNRLAESVEH